MCHFNITECNYLLILDTFKIIKFSKPLAIEFHDFSCEVLGMGPISISSFLTPKGTQCGNQLLQKVAIHHFHPDIGKTKKAQTVYSTWLKLTWSHGLSRMLVRVVKREKKKAKKNYLIFKFALAIKYCFYYFFFRFAMQSSIENKP